MSEVMGWVVIVGVYVWVVLSLSWLPQRLAGEHPAIKGVAVVAMALHVVFAIMALLVCLVREAIIAVY